MDDLGELEVISFYLEDNRLNVLLAPRDEASRERRARLASIARNVG